MKRVLFILVTLLLLVFPLSGSGQEYRPRRPAFFPMVCNLLLPGFGVGSFIQGDWVGGSFQLGTQLLCLAGFLGVIHCQQGDNPSIGGSLLGYGCALLSLGSRVCGLMCASDYAEGSFPSVPPVADSVDIAPSITPSAENWQPDVGVQFMVRYTIE